MSENLITLITILSPAVFVVAAIASWFQSGFKPQLVKRISTIVTLISLAVAIICGFLVINYGLLETNLIGFYDFGFSLRLDAVSALMLGMIAFLGFIIIKFSINYLDGDQRQGAFIGRLAATIASVQLLVLSGNLGLLLTSWILTSISLHRLLLFYHDRPGAQIAARKKFILARLGDVSLLIAIIMLYGHFGSGNLEVIFTAINGNSFANLPFLAAEGPALFLVLAALLKSAQFPTHSWLIEVMETPTPVSALLHAGLLNAGPFLIIRMAFVMDASTAAPVLLMIVGGFTALFASVAYLTQTSVKTALGYSSVAHMGFSLMVCGLGVYPAAMLHLVAHSFYKAHAFLSSGSVVDVMRGAKVKKVTPTMNPIKIFLGMVMALTLYTVFALVWGIDPEKESSLLIIGAVIILGLARILTSAIDSKRNVGLVFQASLMALLVTIAFFSLESGTHYMLASQLPDLTMPGSGKLLAAGVIMLAFGLAVFAQIMAPGLSPKPYYKALAIHVKNGFYASAIFDGLVGALRIYSSESRLAIKESGAHNLPSKPREILEPNEPVGLA
ncbi:MAG: proton-conducting transporter membrane subunit [Cyclobacteriaceae bacterium]|nr:proton-conducting transporter membrane subunit [Cyclobacteriaceae bacterium]